MINKIYDVNFYLFEEKNNLLILLTNWGNIYNNSKIFINICFVDNNHFNVLYELNENKIFCNLKDSKKSENDEKENDTFYKIHIEIKNRDDVDDNNLIGLPDKEYFENLKLIIKEVKYF